MGVRSHPPNSRHVLWFLLPRRFPSLSVRPLPPVLPDSWVRRSGSRSLSLPDLTSGPGSDHETGDTRLPPTTPCTSREVGSLKVEVPLPESPPRTGRRGKTADEDSDPNVKPRLIRLVDRSGSHHDDSLLTVQKTQPALPNRIDRDRQVPSCDNQGSRTGDGAGSWTTFQVLYWLHLFCLHLNPTTPPRTSGRRSPRGPWPGTSVNRDPFQGPRGPVVSLETRTPRLFRSRQP